jgi:hypothetical protein
MSGTGPRASQSTQIGAAIHRKIWSPTRKIAPVSIRRSGHEEQPAPDTQRHADSEVLPLTNSAIFVASSWNTRKLKMSTSTRSTPPSGYESLSLRVSIRNPQTLCSMTLTAFLISRCIGCARNPWATVGFVERDGTGKVRTTARFRLPSKTHSRRECPRCVNASPPVERSRPRVPPITTHEKRAGSSSGRRVLCRSPPSTCPTRN